MFFENTIQYRVYYLRTIILFTEEWEGYVIVIVTALDAASL
jgi:hypothetical protein